MDVDDYVDPKVGVAVAATAVVLSPRVREVLHRGAVYGLAGVLAAGDAITSFARGIGEGTRRVRPRELTGEAADGEPYADGDTAAERESANGGATATRRRQRRTSSPAGDESE